MPPDRAYPSYLGLLESGELEGRIDKLRSLMQPCRLCPRHCGANRLGDERGVCGVEREAILSSAGPHFGEERPLVGRHGSGTIFFGGCNLRCLFCQNHDISIGLAGAPVGVDGLAAAMLRLQELGCHNINLVTPTHVLPQAAGAIALAAREGLRLPIVYNTGGYDSLEAVELLDGVIDIYMPDVKFLSAGRAGELTGAGDYPDVVRAAVREMHRQVGDLDISPRGIAVRGLLVRHLVMPGARDDTAGVVRFLADEISKNTYINVMRQYHPAHRAREHPPLDRPVTTTEWHEAIEAARAAGLHRLDGILDGPA